MTSRGRVSSTSEWDALRDEFNDTAQSFQYPEEERDEKLLDYTKLYITKLPVALVKEGFLELFSKYGNVLHSYLSRDPQKRYAFVTYETAGEARIAMMKLNRTEPFYMSVCFAHLKNNPSVTATPNIKSQTNSEQPSRQHSSMHQSVSNTDRQSDRHQPVSNQSRQHSSIDRHSIDKLSSMDKQSSLGRSSQKVSSIDRHSIDKLSSMDKQSSMGRSSQKVREDSSMSSQSKQRNADTNGEEMEGTEGSDSAVDPNFEYNMEQIKLQRLQLKEQQLIVQERLLIQQQKMKNNNNSSAVTKRRLLPDGHSVQVTQDETSFTAGAGDSNNIPGLQREASRHCVGCGAAAEQFCSGCHVTPYCGERCQRRDWEARHGDVCHNLARFAGINVPKGQPEAPTSALRRPHSPVDARAAGSGVKENVAAAASGDLGFVNTNIIPMPPSGDPGFVNTNIIPMPPSGDPGFVNTNINPMPPVNNFVPNVAMQGAQQRSKLNNYEAQNRMQQRGNQQQPRPNYSGPQDRNHNSESSDFKKDSPNRNRAGVRSFQQAPRQPLRQPAIYQEKPKDETDNVPLATKPSNQVEASKPVEATKPAVATKSIEATKPSVATKPVEVSKPVEATKPAVTTKPVEASKPVEATKPTVATKPVEATKPVVETTPEVPSSFILQKLKAGDVAAVTVVARTSEAESKQAGYVCWTLNDDVMEEYTSLCDEFALQCEKEKEGYKPRIGETFAYFCENEGWYRARCLAPNRCALLDTGRVAEFGPSVCRRLPSTFANVPEFATVIEMEGLEVGACLTAVVVSISALSVKVLMKDSSGSVEIGVADATKWATILEYTQEPEEPQPILSAPKLTEPKKIPEPVKNIPEPVKNIPETVKSGLEPVKPVVKTIESERAPKPLMPDSYEVQKLKVGDNFLAVVDFFDDTERGFVCVTLNPDSANNYDLICNDLPLKCSEDNVEYTPAIGEAFAFFNNEDQLWYRARCLSRTRANLLDMGKFVSFEPSICRKLPNVYADIPEFVAVIKTDKLEVGANANCVVLSTSPTETKVRIEDLDAECQVKRWTPPLEYPVEPAAPTVAIPVRATAATPAISTVASPARSAAATPTRSTAATATNPTVATALIPTLLRPCLEHNAVYILCCMTSLDRACVYQIGSKELYDSALQDTVSYGLTAKPLTKPAEVGQIVVAKFSEDNLCYRAFVKRVSVVKNKYLIEYVEFGNEEIVQLESLYPCPPKLSLEAMPPQASLVRLSDVDAPLTPPAIAYIDNLKDYAEHLILTIPGGDKSKASGCLVNLVIAKNCEPASQKIEDMCLRKYYYQDISSRYTPFSTKSGPVTLTLPYCDANLLANGNIVGYEKGDVNAPKIYEELSQKLQEYGEKTCKTYRPTEREELCIAKNCKVNKWERAVVVDIDTTGVKDPQLMFLEHGNLEDVPTGNILKMLPEFVEQYAIVSRQFDIKDFPISTVTEPQLIRAMQFMKVTPDGRGELTVRAVQAQQDDTYEVHAPELLQALTE